MTDNRFFFLMSQTQALIKRHFDLKITKEGLNISTGQTGLMFLLAEQDKRPMSELSSILNIDNSAITRLIDRLEKHGLVERVQNPEDRRQFLIGITDKGLTQIEKIKTIVKDMNRIITEDFTDSDIETFKRILNKLYAKLK